MPRRGRAGEYDYKYEEGECYEEKFKSAVEVSFHQLDVLVRPYLGEAQNETLSEILEGLVASVAEHSFQIGYSSAMQTFAEAAAALEAGSHVQQ